MNALIMYDSYFGNTERIARAIGEALGSTKDVEIFRVSDVKSHQLTNIKLLIVGSPTRGFRPTPAVKNLLEKIPKDELKGIKVAAFDTRISASDVSIRVVRWMIRLFGYAANPISDRLRKKGGELILPPEGFYVKSSEGPLKDGELERAAEWAKQIVATQ